MDPKFFLTTFVFLLFLWLVPPAAANEPYRSYNLSQLPAKRTFEDISRNASPSIGDLNQDGGLDVVLSDPTDRGQIYVYLHFAHQDTQSPSFRIDGSKEREPIGSFAGIADADGDGKPDLIVGRADRRSAYFVKGPIASPERGRILRLDRRNEKTLPGEFLAFRDLDGDDAVELLVRGSEGAIEVYRDFSTPWFRIKGVSLDVLESGIFSTWMDVFRGAGICMGDPGFGLGGAVFCFALPEDEDSVVDVLHGPDVHRWISPWEGVGFGASVAMFDMNQDGTLDLLVSTRTGRRWAGMYGPITAEKKMDFEVQNAPEKFWLTDFDQDGMGELFTGPPLRWMSNAPPEVDIIGALQKENGWVHLTYNLSDPDGGEFDISMEYNADTGFVRALESYLRGNQHVGTGKGHVLEWNATGNYPKQYLEEGFEYQLLIDDRHFMHSRMLVQGAPMTLDTTPPVVELYAPEFREDGKVVVGGFARDDSNIRGVRFRVEGGNWQQAVPTYSAWDETEEEFEMSFPARDGEKYWLTVEAMDKYGNTSPLSDSTHVRVEVPSDAFGLASDIHLNQAGGTEKVPVALFPNPYSLTSSTPITIQYGLTTDAEVKVFVYSIGGTMAWQVSYMPGEEGGRQGINTVTWDARNAYGNSISTGIFAIKVISGGRLHSGSRLIVVN